MAAAPVQPELVPERARGRPSVGPRVHLGDLVVTRRRLRAGHVSTSYFSGVYRLRSTRTIGSRSAPRSASDIFRSRLGSADTSSVATPAGPSPYRSTSRRAWGSRPGTSAAISTGGPCAGSSSWRSPLHPPQARELGGLDQRRARRRDLCIPGGTSASACSTRTRNSATTATSCSTELGGRIRYSGGRLLMSGAFVRGRPPEARSLACHRSVTPRTAAHLGRM